MEQNINIWCLKSFSSVSLFYIKKEHSFFSLLILLQYNKQSKRISLKEQQKLFYNYCILLFLGL